MNHFEHLPSSCQYWLPILDKVDHTIIFIDSVPSATATFDFVSTIASRMKMRSKVDALLRIVEARGCAAPKLRASKHAHTAEDVLKTNIIAFSGGVDSSLAAKIVYQVFPQSSVACLGISPSLSKQQLEQAREVARHIEIPLWECYTTESQSEKYIENKGQSCYYCKTNLYSTINQVAEFARAKMDENAASSNEKTAKPIIYNGTNADDQLDPTRLGLVAAAEFEVVSPLSHLTKSEVREVAKYLGLSNWNYAASPCLRSRLAFGVEAVEVWTQRSLERILEGHLKRVENAEDFVRKMVNLEPQSNMRVRFLAGNRAAIELDNTALEQAHVQSEAIDLEMRRLGFDSMELRPFRSGSLSGYNPVIPSHHTN
ncbi:hypothetical protein FI667_g10334, partial [Globisporangium splendens]